MKRGRLTLMATMGALALGSAARATMIPGGGPAKKDCLVELSAPGTAFPAGKTLPRGATCYDGDACDQDGEVNGVCEFPAAVCVNMQDERLARCKRFGVKSVRFKKMPVLDTAVAELGLPTSEFRCSTPVTIPVGVAGPDKGGEVKAGKLRIRGHTRGPGGKTREQYRLTCLPSSPPPVIPPPPPPPPVTPGTPGAGLAAAITGASVDPAGIVTVAFTLTDTAGVAVTPVPSSTDDPTEARVRFTIARIDVDTQTIEGFTTTFTKYVNYITGSPAAGNQPTYDTGGTFAPVDAATGTWTYTFGRMLPVGFPTNLTHTVGAQIQREFEGQELVANPVFDFVPDGIPVTTVREDTTTAQCNACHNPLALHGGGRREVHLCQLCHTDQAIDPDTGNTIDFKQMVHRIHRGKDLPSVEDGPVGAKYAIIGFQGAEEVFSEKVNVCVNGPFPNAPCTTDADCSGGTCTGTATVGVGFPQDIRNCTKCHGAGATAANHLALPSTLACTGCHDDVNPGQTAFNGLAPGTGHLAGPQPEAFCRICHTSTADEEFDITVPGAHVIPLRSATLAGLQAEIVSASGTPGNPVQVQFRLRDGMGMPITSYAALNRIGFAISGPTTDYGGASLPRITPTAVGNGASGMLVGPDGTGLSTYTTADSLPADAIGTWAIGLEARQSVSVNGSNVNEAAENPVMNFSVDGSPVAARRQVVEQANCGACHGTFSKDFSIHGNLRNRVEYCVVCHNPNVSDFARRAGQVANGADPMNQSIHFKRLIHKIHRGEELEQQPYIVYGFGGGVNLGEVRFPGDLRDCDTCHTGGSHLLPLPAGLLPTAQTMVDTSTMPASELLIGETPPIQAACLACHDSQPAAAHAAAQTAGGMESCDVCHAEGRLEAVSEVHATEP